MVIVIIITVVVMNKGCGIKDGFDDSADSGRYYSGNSDVLPQVSPAADL